MDVIDFAGGSRHSVLEVHEDDQVQSAPPLRGAAARDLLGGEAVGQDRVCGAELRHPVATEALKVIG